jgi:hypothetical protein
MHFHIDSIEVDVIIEGWRKTIIIDDDNVLQNLNIVSAGSKRIDLSFGLSLANTPYVITAPITICCYPGSRISMELPSKVVATSKEHATVAELTNPIFSLIDLTPTRKSAKIIPVYNVTVPETTE